MTRVIVVSDTHGYTSDLCEIVRTEKADALVFLGDGLRDLDVAEGQKRPGLRVYRVRGNCDFAYPEEPPMGLCSFDGVLCFYTHGHYFGVKSGLWQIEEAAEARGADVALFGHTHRPTLENAENPRHPTLFNPGSLRDGGHYGIMECDEGNAVFYHKILMN